MSNQDNEPHSFKSGLELLKAFGTRTREEQLERACTALMAELNRLHIECYSQDMSTQINDRNVFCSCLDAYRMGHQALKKD